MPATNTQRTEINNHFFRSDSATKPTVWAVALHSGDPGVEGDQNELSGNGYSRVNMAPSDTNWSAHVDGLFSNAREISFFGAIGSDWATATHFSIWDSTSGGSARYYGALDSSVTITVGQAAVFAVGDLTVQI